MKDQENIEILADGGRDIRDAICPVCGQAVGPAPEICPECKTPHHWDCWQFSGGCATYACPWSAGGMRPRQARPVAVATEKIPFPVLEAGRFLGVFNVSTATAVWAIGSEVAMLAAAVSGQSFLIAFFLLSMILALVWAGIKAEVYNIDIVNKRLSKSLLLAGYEAIEWGICPLTEVETFLIRDHVHERRLFHVLSVRLAGNRYLDLTPPFRPGSVDDGRVRELLTKVIKGTTLAVDERALPPSVRQKLL